MNKFIVTYLNKIISRSDRVTFKRLKQLSTGIFMTFFFLHNISFTFLVIKILLYKIIN